jgi:hypothetical protein
MTTSEAQSKADRVRVLGYLEVVRRRRVEAMKRLDGALSIVDRVPAAAQIALNTLNKELEDELIMLKVAARNDPEEFSRIAQALEDMGF